LGDPLADMGSMLAYWPQAGENIGGFAPTTLDGFPDRAEITEMYLDHTGRDRQALKYWHALGLWQIATIAEGVMPRAIDNPANKAAAGTPTAEQINAVVGKAHEIANAAGV